MKFKLTLLTVLFAMATTFAMAQTKGKAKEAATHRIVYDMAAGDTTQHAKFMRHLENIKKMWPDAQIEVVVHSKAIFMLTSANTTQAEAIKGFQAKGVVFTACENSMRANNITKEQLLPAVVPVPMAIGELVLKQEQGWSYIKL